MTINTPRLLQAVFAALTLGIFAITVAAPVTLDNGVLIGKPAYAKKGADDGQDADDDKGVDADDTDDDNGADPQPHS